MRNALSGLLSILLFSVAAICQQPKTASSRDKAGQTASARARAVKMVDEIGLRKLIVPNGKPLMINLWATWCDPCREEFPDLVKLDAEFKGKIDFIAISLDDPADIAVEVPKFLLEMKAEMPVFLLRTADESAAITSISKDWQGGLPFTILFDPKGTAVYFRQGRIDPASVRAEIIRMIAAKEPVEN